MQIVLLNDFYVTVTFTTAVSHVGRPWTLFPTYNLFTAYSCHFILRGLTRLSVKSSDTFIRITVTLRLQRSKLNPESRKTGRRQGFPIDKRYIWQSALLKVNRIFLNRNFVK